MAILALVDAGELGCGVLGAVVIRLFAECDVQCNECDDGRDSRRRHNGNQNLFANAHRELSLSVVPSVSYTTAVLT
jgi:hypothetical protein